MSLNKEIQINKVYRSKTSKFKIVKCNECNKNKCCYRIKLGYRDFFSLWGQLPFHYTLENAKIVIPNLIESDERDDNV
jgi:hypothetical protein